MRAVEVLGGPLGAAIVRNQLQAPQHLTLQVIDPIRDVPQISSSVRRSSRSSRPGVCC
jgi:hypothetical protein